MRILSTSLSLAVVLASAATAQVTGSWTPYGSGCPGTGSDPNAGVVVPANARTVMGNSNNYFPIGRADQRYQQVFVASEFPGPRVIRGMSLRADELSGPAQSQTLEILLGLTTYSPSTLTATYATNATGPQTTVLPSTVVNLPATAANTDPNNFPATIVFTTPFVYTASQNLLLEVRNTSATSQIHPYDAMSGAGTNTTRLWGSPATATSGSLGVNYGLVIRFNTPSANAVPTLSANGRPVINTTHNLDVAQATPNTFALIFLGVSNTMWNVVPLPFDLTPFGAKGCSILSSAEFIFGIGIDAAGNGSFPVPIPNNKAFLSWKYYNQAVVRDVAANGFGYVVTNGGAALVGDV